MVRTLVSMPTRKVLKNREIKLLFVSPGGISIPDKLFY
jgi:hypothetical protein